MTNSKSLTGKQGVALLMALALSGCPQFIVSTFAQASISGSQSKRQGAEEGDTRPRRVDDAKHDSRKRNGGDDEPTIRIGLMTDVASISIGSGAGLSVRRPSDDVKRQKIATNAVRVELRQSTSTVATYRAAPASISQSMSDSNAKKAKSVASGAGESGARRSSIDKDQDDKNRVDKIGYRRLAQVAAFDAERLIASDEAGLVVAPLSNAGEKSGEEKNGGGKNSSAPATGPAALRLGNKDYRGEIHLVVNPRGRLNVVNVLPLEAYLRGVVPLELPPGPYPEIEALKAQAIAARSYALARRNQFNSEGFDLRDDARSQVYGGLSAERQLTNRAVEETRGVVAYYRDADGRGAPIEALYTANCGGRTENNEAIFFGKPVPYLRSVDCAPDRPSSISHEISSGRNVEQLTGSEGRLIARQVAMLDVLGFSLPRRVNSQYLRSLPDEDELEEWIERAAKLARRNRPEGRGDLTRLPAFVSLLARALYGEERPGLLLTAADIDYLLSGLADEETPRESRADIAMFLREGVLRPPSEGRLTARARVTRGYAIETIARALALKPFVSNLSFETATAQAADKGRLTLASQSKSRASDAQARENTPVKSEPVKSEPVKLEMEKGAWLFRRLAGESYEVDRLTLIGGERITYHLNGSGRVDFLEAEPLERGASSDRFSAAAHWRERITREDVERRLARSRLDVGELEDLTPLVYGDSNRVLEIEVVGSRDRKRLRGHQVRSALGLKESLFVITRERDDEGRVVAFLFTGRGWGHGVGMCQTGAFGLAKEGYSHKAILQKYYTGVEIRKIY